MKKIRVLVALLAIASLLLSLSIVPAGAATDEEVGNAIEKGIEYLVSRQRSDGSWGEWEKPAITGLVLIKLQDRAYELGYDSPFDPSYPYSGNVIDGWDYLLKHVSKQEPLPKQDHTGGGGTLDDPDSNANGYGVCFPNEWGWHQVYTTGIALMALKASGTPDRPGIDVDGDATIETFKEIAQDAAEWMAFAQGDLGNDEGGWSYNALDNLGDAPDNPGWVSTDNSNSGYAVLGLAAAEAFGCTVPDWVATELNVWVTTIQDPVNGDADDGGSYYDSDWLPWNPWCNELKGGNLIFQMTMCGDNGATPRFKDAMDYIVRHWKDANNDPGWRGTYGIDDDGDGLIDEDPQEPQIDNDGDGLFNEDWVDGIDNDGDGLVDEDCWESPIDNDGDSNFNEDSGQSNYQAMFCLMKGFEYSSVELIDLDGDNVPEHDWYEEFKDILVDQQNPDGSWFLGWYGSDPLLDTAWALLTLEKIAPPPPEIPVNVDIKPGSWPNPINVGSNGVFAVAICGTDTFDVKTIDPVTLAIYIEGLEEGVAPVRCTYEDAATPYTGDPGGGHALKGDGYVDLVMHFDTEQVVSTLGLKTHVGETIPLIIKGNLREENDGTAIKGQDYVRIQQPQGKK